MKNPETKISDRRSSTIPLVIPRPVNPPPRYLRHYHRKPHVRQYVETSETPVIEENLVEENLLDKVFKTTLGFLSAGGQNRKGRDKKGPEITVLDTIGKIATRSLVNYLTKEVTNILIPKEDKSLTN